MINGLTKTNVSFFSHSYVMQIDYFSWEVTVQLVSIISTCSFKMLSPYSWEEGKIDWRVLHSHALEQLGSGYIIFAHIPFARIKPREPNLSETGKHSPFLFFIKNIFYIYIYLFFLKFFFPFKLFHNIKKSSLCYTVGPCWLSI